MDEVAPPSSVSRVMNPPVVTMEDSGLLFSHNGSLRPLTEERMTLAYRLISNISLEPSTFFGPVSFYPDKEVKISTWWNKSRFTFPLLSKPQRRNWVRPLGLKLLLLYKSFKGLPWAPTAPHGPLAALMFTDRKWQDPGTEAGGWSQGGGAVGGDNSAKEPTLLPMAFSPLYGSSTFFPFS